MTVSNVRGARGRLLLFGDQMLIDIFDVEQLPQQKALVVGEIGHNDFKEVIRLAGDKVARNDLRHLDGATVLAPRMMTEGFSILLVGLACRVIATHNEPSPPKIGGMLPCHTARAWTYCAERMTEIVQRVGVPE